MVKIRDFNEDDSKQVDKLAVSAFEQFKDSYVDWEGFKEKISSMSGLADSGEIIVAEDDGKIVGAVAYVGPGKTKAAFFDKEWPIMRMLVVDPLSRGLGVGSVLAKECISRGIRDGSSLFALHTSEIMDVALPMYQRMGFKWARETPPIHGVEYGVYLKELDC